MQFGNLNKLIIILQHNNLFNEAKLTCILDQTSCPKYLTTPRAGKRLFRWPQSDKT